MITVYTVAYNEEFHVPYMMEHYMERFPNCKFVVYDNMSTDQTVRCAKAYGAEIISYDTNNMFSDIANANIKNNAWKTANTDWVLMCDMDEFLDITEDQLKYEESLGSTIIRSEGYNMINLENNYDFHNIKYGERSTNYDKSYLFNKKFITAINYGMGCHTCNPEGTIKPSINVYLAYHYHFINVDMVVSKYKRNSSRLSPENIKNGWGKHYLITDNEAREKYLGICNRAKKIRS